LASASLQSAAIVPQSLLAKNDGKKRTVPARQRSLFSAPSINSFYKVLRQVPPISSYAVSGMALVVRTADTLFFNHTFALHRPTNGATMTNANATLIVITIKTSPFSSLKVFKTLQG
jgi:hypothetical protein